jgi:probable rRNA maturation factor
MNARAYPELQLSLQWANPKAMAAHRALLPRHTVTRAIKHALAHPIAGQALNQQYRGKDYATNVLTFDYALSPVLLADLVLCAPVLEREAAEQSKDLRAHYVHLLVHGTLHAMGYDHEHSQTDAAKMEALEILILHGLDMGNPYDA